MCEWGDTVLIHIEGVNRDVDRCIAPLVRVLNESGIKTEASCCGHGHIPGCISLADGRELVVYPTQETSRAFFDSLLVNIHGEKNHGTIMRTAEHWYAEAREAGLLKEDTE